MRERDRVRRQKERGKEHEDVKTATVNRSVRFPNLWLRGGWKDAIAALLVSAEHKLP